MEIDKDVIIKCLDLLPGGFQDFIAHTMVLLAYIVDMAEREFEDKPIRIEANTVSDMLRRKYRVIIEEIVD